VTPLAGETAGQRIARARRRRGLSQAVLAGLVGRSESWLSQVERGRRGIDSHSALTRLAEILRVDVAEIAGPEPGTTDPEHAHPAAPLIEQAMLGCGAPGQAGPGQSERGAQMSHLRTRVRAAYQAYQATRYDAATSRYTPSPHRLGLVTRRLQFRQAKPSTRRRSPPNWWADAPRLIWILPAPMPCAGRTQQR
jgi:transcriptional regulator with XRE-family HTH domain